MKGIEMIQVYEPKQKSAGTGGHPLVATGVFVGLRRHEYGDDKKSMYFLDLEECAGLPRNNDGCTSIRVSEETCQFVDENFQTGDLLRLPIFVSAYIDKKQGNAQVSLNHMKSIAQPMKPTK
jgi:hypothetical protein